MDPSQFDTLTKTLAAVPTRRGLLAALAALVPTAASSRRHGGGGKKNGKGKKRKKTQCTKDSDCDKQGPRLNCVDGNCVCVGNGRCHGCCSGGRCMAADCKGCCEGGRCLKGTDNQACGGGGEPCENCTAVGEGIICRPDGNLPSCGCDVAACASKNGCCEAASRCVPNATGTTLCGTVGLACQTCDEEQVCDGSFESPSLGRVCCGKEGARCGRESSIFTGEDLSRYCCAGFECKGDILGNAFSGRCRESICTLDPPRRSGVAARGGKGDESCCDPPCADDESCCQGACWPAYYHCLGCGPNANYEVPEYSCQFSGGDHCENGECRCGDGPACDCPGTGEVCRNGQCECEALPGEQYCSLYVPPGALKPGQCAGYSIPLDQSCPNVPTSEGEQPTFQLCVRAT